jgi:hypothetical protein
VMTSIRFMALWLSLVLATLSYAAALSSQAGPTRTDTLFHLKALVVEVTLNISARSLGARRTLTDDRRDKERNALLLHDLAARPGRKGTTVSTTSSA